MAIACWSRLGWSAQETADALEGSVAAVNSALQRARARLRELGRPGRLEWSPLAPPTQQERRLVQRYMDAHARADAAAVIELLGDDVRFSMPPELARFEGRDAVAAFFRELFGAGNPGDWRLVPTRANGQPAAANYVRAWGESEYRASTLDALRVKGGELVESADSARMLSGLRKSAGLAPGAWLEQSVSLAFVIAALRVVRSVS